MDFSPLYTSAFFGIALTLLFFFIGQTIQQKSKLDVLNPILLATIGIILVLKLCKIDYEQYNTGASWITILLKPATVALAVPLYRQMELLKKNIVAVVAGVLSGSIASMLSVLGLSAAMKLSPQLYYTLLPKSITTAIGMPLSQELGGMPAVTAAVIAITGIFGACFAQLLWKLFGIHDPVAKGLSIGTCSHAVGTAKAFQLGEVEGALSSLAIVTAGIFTVVVGPFIAGLL